MTILLRSKMQENEKWINLLKDEIHNQEVKGPRRIEDDTQRSNQNDIEIGPELKQKIAAMEMKLRLLAFEDDDEEREKIVILKGFEECTEEETEHGWRQNSRRINVLMQRLAIKEISADSYGPNLKPKRWEMKQSKQMQSLQKR